eukprot:TRINITY_DN6748_c0_g1_i1.p1 TRINITY_DN6748_c0_g1~~TRINITY_DN6748_c0_g1_i1.p1  ORF type:complete len:893 (-),score=212.78 TRINITY_DN6748_c0_g1_i1:150-2450(-)
MGALEGVSGGDGHHVGDAAVGKTFSARAYLLAKEAIDRDAKMSRARPITREGETQVEDVQKRQLALLFAEVPQFELFLPPGLETEALLPGDFRRTLAEDTRERRAAEKQVQRFSDPYWVEGRREEWLLTQEEVLELDAAVELWIKAAGGESAQTVWVDRPTFCRMILDVGLVDAKLVPFHWAVSLFDAVASYVSCSPDAPGGSNAPCMFGVDRWTLVTVLDVLLRQIYDKTSRHGFMSQLRRAVEQRYPGADLQRSVAARRAEEVEQNLMTPQSTKGLARRGSDFYAPGSLLEKPSPDIDTALERTRFDETVCWMLVEPEVLHLSLQHLPLFEALHGCYADAKGGMNFSALLQCCTDFRLTPDLVSSDCLRHTFETSLCWEVVEGAAPTPRTLSDATSHGGRRKRPSHKADANEGPGRFGAAALMEAMCRLAFTHLGRYGNAVQRSTGGYARFVWLLVYLRHTAARRVKEAAKDVSGRAAAASGPLRKAIEACYPELYGLKRADGEPQGAAPASEDGLEDAPERKQWPLRPSRGRSAKWPTVRRASALGRSQKTQNLVLRFAGNLKKKVQDSKEEQPSPESGSPKKGDAQGAESDASSDADLHETTAHFNAIAVRFVQTTKENAFAMRSSGPRPEGAKQRLKLRVEFSLGGKAGEPFVLEGTCEVCKRSAGGQEMGNPRCFGCSLVDGQAFTSHPFRYILYKRPAGEQTTKFVARRASIRQKEKLTPPAGDGLMAEIMRLQFANAPSSSAALFAQPEELPTVGEVC